ncbi:MAG: selenide, water dikinase SelD [Elainellaceae cyanobacterium]
MKSSTPIVKDLVLIGGGHSHAIALKMLGMNPLPDVRLTLITDVYHTPYSGMLPGYVAGLYTFDDCHIDLRTLSQFAQAWMIPDRAIGLDLETNRVLCKHHPPIAFDVLSIDIGSTPATVNVQGANEFAIPVKPISKFLNYWDNFIQTVKDRPQIPRRIGIVGGGAGGVELALSAQAHLQTVYRAAQQPIQNIEVHLFQRGAELLPGRHPSVRRKFHRLFARRGIQLHVEEAVVAIEAHTADSIRRVICESGLTVECDRVFWVTQASATPWLEKSGLATTEHGFIKVNDCLQSVSHPHVFAAGDVATLINHPRPKAGVFAVRQGKPLYENLRRSLRDRPLNTFIPQKQFLILIGTGKASAIASRGGFTLGPSRLIWWWKDHIDRKFMHQFEDLNQMNHDGGQTPWGLETRKKAPSSPSTSQYSPSDSIMHCAGCGSKVGGSILEKVLTRIQREYPIRNNRDDILIGLDEPDDAAAIRVPAGQALLQTIDYFPALVNDHYVFGQIATHHCLSDIFAMGAIPQSALAIATLPYAVPSKQEEMLYQLLSGAVKVLREVRAPLIGGHTSESAELAFGLTCNGLATPSKLLRKGGMQPGNRLILTKALGTGTLFAADMRCKAKGRWIEAAIASMLQSNYKAAQCLWQYKATACTDVTGFGLVGHLLEMVDASQVTVELEGSTIPVLDGVDETLTSGIASSLYPQNVKASINIDTLHAIQNHPLFPVLFDPQTSGGLLASVPGDRASACLSALHVLGYDQSQIIGQVLPLEAQQKPIRVNGWE